MRHRLRAALACVLLAFACVTPAQAAMPSAFDAFSRADRVEIDRLVRDVCRRDIVVLGEDANHGAARTVQVKIAITQRLVARCGFGAVLFESQMYDVLDYAQAAAEGRGDVALLADAIGPVWSRMPETRPLFDWLHGEVVAGRLRVGGIDPQVGGRTGRYAKVKLGTELASVLDEPRRTDCNREFDRHDRWQYDDASPFDADAQARLRACSDAVRAALAAHGIDPMSDIAGMATAYGRYLEMALDGDGDRRDLGMAELVDWHRARWPRGTRVVVWCAAVHAAKRLDNIAPAMVPMGAHLAAAHGDRVAAIGFSAAGGTYGDLSGAVHALPPAGPEALETVALADARGDLRYLDRRWLRRHGVMTARPINDRLVHAAAWADVLDGVMVLREERAPGAPDR
jgi:erythromycin esterase-like protein